MMEKHIEKCPHCSENVEGVADYSLMRIATQKGVAAGINKLLMWAIVTPIASSIIFPAFGTFFGFLVTCVLLYKIKNYSQSMSMQLDSSLYRNVDYNFSCPYCGHKWRQTFVSGSSTIPDEILEIEKQNRLNFCRSLRNKFGLATLISGALTVSGIVYCSLYDSNIDTGTTRDTIFGRQEVYETNY